jgi:O-antigen/teichoic acid export membrane protein
MATSLVAIATALTNLGLRGAFIRSVARDPGIARVALAEQMGIRLALSFASAGMAILCAVMLRYPIEVVGCTAVTAIGLILITVSSTTADLLQAFQRLETVAVINVMAGVALTAVSIAAVWFGAGPVGVAAAYLVGPALSTMLFLRIVRRRYFGVQIRWDVRRGLRLLWEARYFAVQQLVPSASNNLDAVMVPNLLGTAPFGYFSAGALLANRLVAVPDGIGSAAYPAIVDAHGRGPMAAVRVFARFLAASVLISLAVAFGVTLLARPIAQFLFPGRAELCEQVIRITIWMIPLMSVQSILFHGINAINRDATQAKSMFWAAMLNISLTAALVWTHGIVGACWAIVLRYPVYLLMLTPCGLRLLMSYFRYAPGAHVPTGGMSNVATSGEPQSGAASNTNRE